MGFATILLLCLIYFLIGGFWKDTIKIYAAPVTASSLVFLLGILNRFSVYLPFQEMAGGEFISTLGNINWFCGYFSVIAPIGFAMYFLWSARTEDSCFDDRKGLIGEFLAILLLCLVFTSAFSQGRDVYKRQALYSPGKIHRVRTRDAHREVRNRTSWWLPLYRR